MRPWRDFALSRKSKRLAFIEMLRHLIFVTDAWVGVGVLGSNVRHPLGSPPFR